MDVRVGVATGDTEDAVERVPESSWLNHVGDVLLVGLRRLGGASWESTVTALVVAASVGFVFVTVHPRLIFTENTPTGGDMGSHVWGPMYLMREVLPNWRLSGWTPDWYAGFPAYQFYMVVPMLAVVVLNVGVRSPLLIVSLPATLALVPTGWFVPRLHRYRWGLFGLGVFLALLVVPVPYGVSFKLVAVSGLLGLPVAAWALGRMAGAPFPVPPALALGSLFFIYNLEPTLNSGTGNIIGGNMTSTMAGEFSFSLSLSLGLLYLGCLIRGLRTGRGRGVTAVLLALCGLCHIIPAFYMLAATAVALVCWPGWARLRWFAPVGPVAGLLAAFWIVPFAGRHAYVNDMGWERLPHQGAGERAVSAWVSMSGRSQLVALLLAAAPCLGLAAWWAWRRRPWLAAAASVGALVSAACARLVLLNIAALDVGLGTAPELDNDGRSQILLSYLKPDALHAPLVAAAAGLVIGIVLQRRLAYLLGAMVVLSGVAFCHIPDGRLWNARILPLYYLSIFLLAALGIAEVIRAVAVLVSPDPERPIPWIAVGAAVPATVAVIIFLGGPLGDALPTARTTPSGQVVFAGTTREFRNPGSYWARYNFRGLEGQRPVKNAPDDAAVPTGQGGWPEYRDLVATMDRLGRDGDHGCGRAFWEFSRERLGTYGTTMTPMMLPYFTEGCIGSMEGLYFESSATTPYHFLVQCQLSIPGSCSQRDLAYPQTGFDLESGLSQLELLGVKYYIAVSDTAVDQAALSKRLTEVAVSGPWHVYELDARRNQLVVGLHNQPVVLNGVEATQNSWLDPAAAWFLDPERWDVPFALDGPEEWARVELPPLSRTTPEGETRRYGDRDLPEFPQRSVRPAEVSQIRTTSDSISFRVDQPGTPVLVKVSYFPNWEVDGAEGPWRVSPNLMVVVPSSRDVTLTYGRTSLDWAAYLLTFLGLLALVGMWRLGPRPIPEGWLDRRRRERVEARPAQDDGWGSGGTSPPIEPRPPTPPTSADPTHRPDRAGFADDLSDGFGFADTDLDGWPPMPTGPPLAPEQPP